MEKETIARLIENFKKKPVLYLKFDRTLCDLNRYIEMERTNRFIAANVKKTETREICLLAHSQTKARLSGQYDVLFVWLTRHRKDHDNISFAQKFILDGLVSANILTNDNPAHVRNLLHVFGTGEGVEVFLFETK
jgi:hypothetical protein